MKPQPIYFVTDVGIHREDNEIWVWGKHSLAPNDVLQVIGTGEHMRIQEAIQVNPSEWKISVVRGVEGTTPSFIPAESNLLLRGFAQKEKEKKP